MTQPPPEPGSPLPTEDPQTVAVNNAGIILEDLADALDQMTGTWAEHAATEAAQLRGIAHNLAGGHELDRAYVGREWFSTLCTYIGQGDIDYETLTQGQVKNKLR